MTDSPRITAVVLSMGEPTLDRALASIARQTLPVADVVEVTGVSPFHRALSEGATHVRTEYFLQVDADMVLDPDCAERLAACTGTSVGAVIGLLRDPLYGRVEAIKLWRTQDVCRAGIPDSVSPDTDFLEDMRGRGSLAVFALRHDGASAEAWHTFGEHRPDYDDLLYTFEKHKRDGRRLRYRGRAESIPYHLDVLHRSPHPAGILAEIALAHGLFLDWEGDRQEPAHAGEDFRFLVDFLSDRSGASLPAPSGRRSGVSDLLTLATLRTAGSAFRRSYDLGTTLARTWRSNRFERELASLHRRRHPWAWLLQAALCRGLFAGRAPGADADSDWRRLGVFGEHLRATAPLRLLAADVTRRARLLPPRLRRRRR